MNKLFKLIYVNLLNLFDINKIIIAREDGVKSNLEKKTVITGIIVIVYGFILYNLYNYLKFSDPFVILSFSFLISSILCLFMTLPLIEPVILKNDDNEVLFAMPVTRQQILFSKLFSIYLRNLVLTAVMMISAILSYTNYGMKIDDAFGLMYMISTLIIPLVPIVLATIISYFNCYLKVKSNNSFLYKIGKLLIYILLVGLMILLFKDIKTSNIADMFNILNKKFNYIYPLNYLFYISLHGRNVISFLGLVCVSILVIYLYTQLLSNNYLRICSLLKGVRKKEEFVYKKTLNMKKFGGILRKEIHFIFNNKFYFRNSFGVLMFFSLLLLLVVNVFDFSILDKVQYIDVYLNLYIPTILAFFVTIGGTAISSMSLEKDNMQILRTMPISMGKIITAKWFANVLLGIIFVIINGSLVWIFLDLSFWGILFSYLLPFVALLFVSLTSVILDYRFIEKNEKDDNAIIKQRFITMFPMFLAVVISVGPFFIPPNKQYELLLSSYVLGMILLMMCEWMYLMINSKKLVSNLFN